MYSLWKIKICTNVPQLVVRTAALFAHTKKVRKIFVKNVITKFNMLNKIKNKIDIRKTEDGEGQDAYIVRITNKTTGEVVYENESKAGLLATLETGKIEKDEVSGQHQIAGWGNLMYQAHLSLMAKRYFKNHAKDLVKALKDSGALISTPEEAEEFFKNL
jgi:hypothetical protein